MCETQKKTDIKSTIEGLEIELHPCGRFASFDYCYNYFRRTENLLADLEKSCNVLGYFLASWGMLRGGSNLSGKSIVHYKPVIKYLNELKKINHTIWKIDVDNYSEENIKLILDVYAQIKEKLLKKGKFHKTVVTKVILGVFGCIPAFDTNFTKAFSNFANHRKVSFNKVDEKSLGFIRDFYKDNKTIIDCLSNYFTTTDFVTEAKTNINYPKAKIIDMYGFAKGK